MNRKIFLFLFTFFFIACQPKTVVEYERRPYKVIEKEMHVELDPMTELFFDVKSTTVVYTLVLERNGNVATQEVSKNEYYRYNVGDTYMLSVLVTKPNPKYHE